MNLRQGYFRLDCYGSEVFEGWTEGDIWNGWATPMFEKQAADQLVAATLRIWNSWVDVGNGAGASGC